VFARNAEDGRLTFIAETNLTGDVDFPSHVQVSPDKKFVIVAGFDGEVVSFARDGAQGQLRRIMGLQVPRPLSLAPQVRDLALSRDGLHVYVIDSGNNVITQFALNPANGVLSQVRFYANGGNDVDGDPISGMLGPRAIHRTHDNSQLYVSTINGIVLFQRNLLTGELSWQRLLPSRDVGDEAAFQMVTSRDGTRAYHLDFFTSTVSTLSRDWISPVKNDFDEDGRTDVGCFFPETGVWYVYRSTEGFVSEPLLGPGSVPFTGDFDGDGNLDGAIFIAETGVFRFVFHSGGTAEDTFAVDSALPIVGDFNGDGVMDNGVYAPATGDWVLRGLGFSERTFRFGFPGTIPLVADLDGDGIDDIGCYFPPLGQWFFYASSLGFLEFRFGFDGTTPVVADLDADGKDDIGCYHPPSGNWFFFRSRDGFVNFQFGFDGTTPLVGDYDGDTIDDVGCYFPPLGLWFVFASTIGQQEWQFGFDGTLPLR
jgi:hypothetical protein